MFEPYSMKKNVVYLVLAPHSSFVPQLKKFFRDLSIIFKVRERRGGGREEEGKQSSK